MNETKTFTDKVIEIQLNLKAPKSQFNKFGGYKYRKCEDILEAVKPLLAEQGLYLTINDDIIMVGDRYYIKATATITDGKQSLSNTAFAREEDNKKGMDASQVTGTASSYARKYALNGLLAIDDTQDADTMDNSQPTKAKAEAPDKAKIIADVYAAKTVDEIGRIFKSVPSLAKDTELITACSQAKQRLLQNA